MRLEVGKRMSCQQLADGSIQVTATSWRRTLFGRRRSRTYAYKLPPGSKPPSTAKQAWREARRRKGS
jgi:hypothetical protein